MKRGVLTALAVALGLQASSALAQATGNDSSMLPLMAAWQQALEERQPEVARTLRWPRGGDVAAIGALMFELADVAPMSRLPLPAELAPYAHQFAGDMMKSPVLVRVAMHGDQPLYLAFNKRPDSPPPAVVRAFVGFVLCGGQALVASQPGLRALTGTELSQELAKLGGYVASLDPLLPLYAAGAVLQGEIRSVGSDGMKSLMERWMNDFRALQPGVKRGQRWEHLGTLNGFHALMANETDLAPMGRELWPDEAAAYASQQAGQQPLEVRVARGGFNTPQRTTAQAVFVNAGNPLQSITLPQLAAALGAAPTITRWGQLGLTGDWAERPITVATPPRITPNAMSMQMMVLQGRAWNAAAHEASVADTAASIATDPTALGFGGLEDGGPGLKTLPVARDAGSPAVPLNSETASNGSYPLTRYMYIRLQRHPGQALAAPVREFLRFVLSREGQEPVAYSGYFPLTAKEVAQELAKLD